MIRTLLFPLFNQCTHDYHTPLHYFLSILFAALILFVIGCNIGLTSFPVKEFLLFWAAGVVIGHYQYIFINRERLRIMDVPDIYLWLAWTPFSISMVVQVIVLAIVLVPISIIIRAIWFVLKSYKKQLDKIFNIENTWY